jgi:hypothetical protein
MLLQGPAINHGLLCNMAKRSDIHHLSFDIRHSSFQIVILYVFGVSSACSMETLLRPFCLETYMALSAR